MKQNQIFQGLIAALMIFPMVGSTVNGQERKTVEIKTKLIAIDREPGQYQLKLAFDIEKGWHIYGQSKTENPSIQTSVDLELPTGVEKVKGWVTPTGKIKADRSIIYAGKFDFVHVLNIKPGPADRKISLEVEYQVCDEKRCQPPTSVQLSVAVPKVAAIAKKNEAPAFQNELFEAPVRLTVGAQLLNQAAKQMYPSPAMYDVDGDGQNELIVGDIFGSLNVYENRRAGKSGDPEWESHVGLKSADGKKIKVSNW